MATTSSSQLENILSAVLKSGDVRPLHEFLEMNAYKGVSINCSKQFLNKLDKLVSSSLDKKETRSACLGFESLHKCGKDLKLPGGQGVSGLISQGLIQKMVQWFEKCRKLWIQQGPHWDKTMYVLCENFLNVLMMVHESCKEGTSEVTDSFLYPVGQLAVDPRIYILIQKEAIRKYNIILDKMPLDFKKNRRLLSSQEASDIMTKLAGRILDSGDYDMQSSLMEALFRMVTPDQRRKLADRWFSMGHVATAFAQISDSEFETACRRFLNMVNGMQGDKRRVCSYPCLKVYLGKYELLMPSDEKLEEFWIDFNLGSRSISFYFSLPDEEDAHWETVCIDEHEVQSYTVTEVGKRQILQIKLSEVIVIDSVEGSILCIQFSSSLDILQAAQNVFGNDKNKSIHEVKAAVKATEADNIAQQSSQVVPESQVSLGETEKTPAPYDLPTATAQMVTPAKKRMSESTTYISSNERGSVKTSSFLPDKSSTKNNSKIPMVKLSVCGTTIMNCSTNTTPHSTNMVDKSGQLYLTTLLSETYFVPDTQPSSACNTKSNWSKLSMSEMLTMPTQKMGSVPEPNWGTFEPQKHCTSSGRMSVPASSLKLQQQFHNELTERLQKVLNDVSKDPPRQESTDQQRKTSDSKRGSDKTKLYNTRGSKSVPKIQNTQRTSLSKNAKREEMSLQVDIGPTKASDKTCTNKTVEDHKEFEAKGCKKTAISTKEKSDSNVTATMMKRISSHYEIETKTLRKNSSDKSSPSWIPPLTDRPIFNKEVIPACRKDKLGTISLGKLLNSTRGSDRNDSFAFKVDSPISVRGENQTKSSSGYNNSTIHTSAKKGQPVAKKKLHVKKHLFSDTDTDNAPTDISWLKESSRKSKAQVITYTRHAKLKPKTAPPHSPDTPRDLQSISSKGVKGESKRIQKIINPPKKVNQVTDLRPQVATKRPRRAAATTTKSYQEPKTDESDSETEEPPSPKHSSTCNIKNPEKVNGVATAKKKKTAHKQPTDMKLSEKQSVLDACPFSKVEICSAGQQRKRVENCAEDPPVKKSKHNLYDHPAEKHSRADGSSLTDSKKAHFK
ncbi:PREDICTED: synaptonemal complex protein 2-like, partial [Cyprinodon variegatus]|uniref:synaptonemal complex protein 2-like n=1 Tax=Cyprinodon variegatus TaxID=28743 RepID=UPI000742CDBC